MTQSSKDVDDHSSTQKRKYRSNRHWLENSDVEDEISKSLQWWLRRQSSNSKIIEGIWKFGIICQYNYRTVLYTQICSHHTIQYDIIGTEWSKPNFAKINDWFEEALIYCHCSRHYFSEMTPDYDRQPRLNICSKRHPATWIMSLIICPQWH